VWARKTAWETDCGVRAFGRPVRPDVRALQQARKRDAPLSISTSTLNSSAFALEEEEACPKGYTCRDCLLLGLKPNNPFFISFFG
jgi:hypothetical protein